MDNFENISALRVNLYECEEPPAKYFDSNRPKNAINHAWIPQTICDQIWVLYEFKDRESRLEWEFSLPPKLFNWLDRNMIKYASEYGWGVRNVNGFKNGFVIFDWQGN